MRSNVRASLLLFALAMGVRLLAVAVMGPVMEPDSFAYDNLAENLAAGRGYVDTRPLGSGDAALARTPLYPAFLAAIYVVAGRRLLVAVLLLQLLSAATVVVAYRAALMVLGQRMAFVVGVVTAVHPWLAILGNAVMTETLFALLVMLALLWCLRGLAARSWKSLCGCGLALGLSVLCRPTMLYFPLLVPFLGLPYQHRLASIVRRAACVWLSFAAVVLPWMYHNYKYENYFGIAPLMGTLLLRVGPHPAEIAGNDPFHTAVRDTCLRRTASIRSVMPDAGTCGAGLRFSSGQVPCVYAAMWALRHRHYSMAEIDRQFLRIAVEQAIRHPLYYLLGTAYRAAFLWSGYPTEYLGGSFDRPLGDNLRAGERWVPTIKVVCRARPAPCSDDRLGGVRSSP